MSKDVTYLELSQESGSSHKFYEITVEDVTVTIRYGESEIQGKVVVKPILLRKKPSKMPKKKLMKKLKRL
jgi:predicted DNA-binding WGR domain protein